MVGIPHSFWVVQWSYPVQRTSVSKVKESPPKRRWQRGKEMQGNPDEVQAGTVLESSDWRGLWLFLEKEIRPKFVGCKPRAAQEHPPTHSFFFTTRNANSAEWKLKQKKKTPSTDSSRFSVEVINPAHGVQRPAPQTAKKWRTPLRTRISSSTPERPTGPWLGGPPATEPDRDPPRTPRLLNSIASNHEYFCPCQPWHWCRRSRQHGLQVSPHPTMRAPFTRLREGGWWWSASRLQVDPRWAPDKSLLIQPVHHPSQLQKASQRRALRPISPSLPIVETSRGACAMHLPTMPRMQQGPFGPHSAIETSQSHWE